MLYGKPLLERIRDITQNFSTQSVKPDSLLTPFRQMALELYIHKNEATAKFVICMFSYFILVFSLSTSFFQAKREGSFEAHHVLIPKRRLGDAKIL